jgi:hypothetical protein
MYIQSSATADMERREYKGALYIRLNFGFIEVFES